MKRRMDLGAIAAASIAAALTDPASAEDVVITGAMREGPASPSAKPPAKLPANLVVQPAPASASTGNRATTKSNPKTTVETVQEAAPVTLASTHSTPIKGSLYPSDEDEPNTELNVALGPASYVLNRSRNEAQFRADIRQAIGAHPAFFAELAQLDQSDAARRRERAALFPQLSTQFRGDYAIARDFDDDTDNVVESLRPREQFTAGVSASQLLFDGGATFQRIKSAIARNKETKNALSVRVNDLAFAGLSAYHDVVTHQALVALGDAFIARHEKILADVKERQRLGAGSQADVTQTIARLAAARARVSEIRESGAVADVRYMEFFNAPPTRLDRPAFDPAERQDREQIVAMALSANPQIAAAAARADAAKADFKAAKGARYPELRLSVDAVKFDLFDSGDDFDVRAGVNVNYDIFNGGARGADIAAARARAKQQDFSAEQVRREITRDAATAYERFQGADRRLDALADAFVNHDKTRKLVLERYKLSRGDLIDVLQAENDYFNAGVAYVTGLANRDLNAYGLMEQTGDLLRLFSPQPEFADPGANG